MPEQAAITETVPSVLTISGLTKCYPPRVEALVDFDLAVAPGEIVALLGMNGAGKSTVVRLLSGVEQPTAGRIAVRGQDLDLAVPSDANAAGIGVVHQELPLLDHLTAAENLVIGREASSLRGLLGPPRVGAARREYARLAAGFPTAPAADTLVSDMDLPKRQIVAIMRALASDARVLLFDEAASSLATAERGRLLAALRQVAEEGVGIIYVTHFLDEALALCDSVVTLRDGRVVLRSAAHAISTVDIVAAMTGEAGAAQAPATHQTPSDANRATSDGTLDVDSFRTRGAGPLSLRVGPGEIVGLYGLEGCGASELLSAAFGMQRYDGSVTWCGKALAGDTSARVACGVVLVLGDRSRMLIRSWTVADNLSLTELSQGRWYWRPTRAGDRGRVLSLIDRLAIKGHADDDVAALSGGNQQKVSLGRFLSHERIACLADDPSRGIDVSSRAQVHHMLRAVAERGNPVLVHSADPQEVVELCHRAVVLVGGEIVRVLEGPEISVAALEGSSRLGDPVAEVGVGHGGQHA